MTLGSSHLLHVLPQALPHPSFNIQPDFTPFAETKWEPWHLVHSPVVALNTLRYRFHPWHQHSLPCLDYLRPGISSWINEQHQHDRWQNTHNTMVTKARMAWRGHSRGFSRWHRDTGQLFSERLGDPIAGLPGDKKFTVNFPGIESYLLDGPKALITIGFKTINWESWSI